MSDAPAWKRYPFVPDWGDPNWFTFPACDGDARQLGVQTYFLDAFLRGRSTGTQYAFMTIFTDARVFNRQLRASFFTVALYDCDRRHYGTYTDFDFPTNPEEGSGTKMQTTPDHLGLRYHASAGPCTWANAHHPDGSLRPFAWTMQLHGIDHHGARMQVDLEVEAARPPAPLGGRELGGEMMFL